jgi:hypothetical protein
MADIRKIALSGLHVTPFIKLERTRYCLMFIKATINRQHDVLLLIDTAASSTVLTRALADRLAIVAADNRYVGHTVDDARSFRYQKATIERLEAGGQAVENFTVLISERELYYANSHYASNGIDGFDGLLGADFLSRFCVSIDVPNDQIEFAVLRDSATPESPHELCIDFRFDKFAVIVELEVAEGVKGNFILDTGAACSVFSTRIARALDVKDDQTETIPLKRARGIGGMMFFWPAWRFQRSSFWFRISTIHQYFATSASMEFWAAISFTTLGSHSITQTASSRLTGLPEKRRL